MKTSIKQRTLLLLIAMAFSPLVCTAKSLVINLSNGTSIYYKLSSEAPPRMVMQQDGTFTLNTALYSFSEVESFEISATDYSGEEDTADGIASISNGQVTMTGKVSIYTLDGKLVNATGNLQSLSRGTYIITNGTRTFKIVKP